MVLGLSASSQVSSARKILDQLFIRRLQLMVAESAYEEASARLEKMFDNIPFPNDSDLKNKRNLRTCMAAMAGTDWPTQLDTSLTAKASKDDGVQVSPVSIRVADWLLGQTGSPRQLPGGKWAVVIQEISIVEMKVQVTVVRGSTHVTGNFSTRRYMDASGDQGDTHARLHILPRDMVQQFPDITF